MVTDAEMRRGERRGGGQKERKEWGEPSTFGPLLQIWRVGCGPVRGNGLFLRPLWRKLNGPELLPSLVKIV
jgi:hypothetical protein